MGEGFAAFGYDDDNQGDCTITCSTVISACEKCGKWKEALQFWSVMKLLRVDSNTVTCNAAISVCEKGHEWKRALQVSSGIVQSNAELDTISFRSTISASEKGDEWKRLYGFCVYCEERG